jgi:integrase
MKSDGLTVPAAAPSVAAGELGALGLYLATLAPSSRRSLLWRLERAVSFLGHRGPMNWGQLEYHQAVEIRARAAETYAPRTASAIIAAVRSICREAWRAGLMDGERYRRIQAVPNVKGSSAPSGRWVSRAELRDLFASCEPSAAGDRDAAILALLFGAGLRRGELSTLTRDDLEAGAVVVREGKGRKSRRVAVSPGVTDALSPWMSRIEGGTLIRQVNKGGAISSKGMTGEAIRRRCVAICKRAGVDTFRPHDARRSFASGLLDAGADLSVVARLLGHASVQVTVGYDRRGERAEIEAAGLVRLPCARSLSPREPLQGSGSPHEPPEGSEDVD